MTKGFLMNYYLPSPEQFATAKGGWLDLGFCCASYIQVDGDLNFTTISPAAGKIKISPMRVCQ